VGTRRADIDRLEGTVIRGRLIHPEVLRALAGAGHGSTVLISDGNFPHDTAPSQDAVRVYLNLAPDLLTVSDVLPVLLASIAVERAAVMSPEDPDEAVPVAHAEIESRLPAGTPIERIPRTAFYAATQADTLALVVATGDRRPYANVLLTIGVVLGED
jgi:L-fucose mutarotase